MTDRYPETFLDMLRDEERESFREAEPDWDKPTRIEAEQEPLTAWQKRSLNARLEMKDDK